MCVCVPNSNHLVKRSLRNVIIKKAKGSDEAIAVSLLWHDARPPFSRLAARAHTTTITFLPCFLLSSQFGCLSVLNAGFTWASMSLMGTIYLPSCLPNCPPAWPPRLFSTPTPQSLPISVPLHSACQRSKVVQTVQTRPIYTLKPRVRLSIKSQDWRPGMMSKVVPPTFKRVKFHSLLLCNCQVYTIIHISCISSEKDANMQKNLFELFINCWNGFDRFIFKSKSLPNNIKAVVYILLSIY